MRALIESGHFAKNGCLHRCSYAISQSPLQGSFRCPRSFLGHSRLRPAPGRECGGPELRCRLRASAAAAQQHTADLQSGAAGDTGRRPSAFPVAADAVDPVPAQSGPTRRADAQAADIADHHGYFTLI